jgi:diguanylate cyclase (GGDEF)-like protein
MNTHVLIPLVATIAYIPLLVIVLANRPWEPQRRLFFLFLVPAMLWSATDIFFRSSIFNDEQQKLILVKIVLFFAVWMIVQYRYFLQSFYQSDVAKKPFAYIILAVFIGLLAAPDLIPYGQPGIEHGITFTMLNSDITNMHVNYGPFVYAIAAVFLAIYARDMYGLIRKLKVPDNVEQRNQIIYLFVGLACLAIFGILTFRFSAQGISVGHIGNFLNACILTYAVVTYRLLDVRVVARRAIMYIVLYGGGLGILLLLAWPIYHFISSHVVKFETIALFIVLGFTAVLFLVHRMRDFWQRKVEEAFIGEKYHYRNLLSKFINTIQNVSSMKQFGDGFVSLVSQSIGCRRACLLLPEAQVGGFNTRFIYPPEKDNPMSELKLRADNPIVTWLKENRILLHERNLSIFPEFKSIWQEESEAIQSLGIEAFVPLVNAEELVGILVVGEKRGGKSYTVEDFHLLNEIGAQVAASMEKEYSHEQLKEQEAEMNLVNRLAKIITSSMSINLIFEAFVDELKQVVDIDWATIAMVDGDEVYFLALTSTVESVWQLEERIPLKGTATESACRERRAVYEPDLTRHHKFSTWQKYLKQGVSSVVYLPLSVADRTVGTLILASRRPNAYDRDQIRLLEKVALQIAAPIENAQLYARVERKSRIDELTGLFNRRHFEERLKEEVARHSRYDSALSLLMVDLDNFKTYNDVYGHPAGDSLLSQIGSTVRGAIRDADQAFRYGGDEFVVILPQTARDDAYVVADRVREQIASEMGQRSITVTCSIGLASYPVDGVIAEELVIAADTALYYAKWTGGNRIYFSSKAMSESPDSGKSHGRRDGLSAVYALVSVVESRDPYVYGHSRKVNAYAVALTEALGLPPDEVSAVSTAALLHDIGKIGIPDEVLNKKEQLSRENWEAIKAHPRLGKNIVTSIPQLVHCADSILYHHEKWDGSGYPAGLKGEEIPIGARIIAVADSFEAMTSARPYRPPLSREEASKELRKGAGIQFDPKLVEAFIGVIATGLPGKVEVSQDALI